MSFFLNMWSRMTLSSTSVSFPQQLCWSVAVSNTILLLFFPCRVYASEATTYKNRQKWRDTDRECLSLLLRLLILRGNSSTNTWTLHKSLDALFSYFLLSFSFLFRLDCFFPPSLRGLRAWPRKGKASDNRTRTDAVLVWLYHNYDMTLVLSIIKRGSHAPAERVDTLRPRLGL